MALLFMFDSEPLNMAHWLVMAALMLVVPLTMRSVESLIEKDLRLFRICRPIASLLGLASLLIAPGPTAGFFAAGWTLFTLGLGFEGVLFLRKAKGCVGYASAFALIMLAGGGVWLFMSRAAWPDIPFSPFVVLLTVAHFHYAGFAALMFLALQERAIKAKTDRWGWLIFGGITLGYGLVAIGISGPRMLEGIGAALMCLGLVIHAVRTLFFLVPRVKTTWRRCFLVASALSVIVAMTLAVTYGYGRAFGIGTISMDTMLHVHAPLNALGFILLGLHGVVGSESLVEQAS